MKKLLLLFSILFSLNSIAQISFTTDLNVVIEDYDTTYSYAPTNIFLSTNSLTLQSVELGTIVFDLYAPVSEKAADNTYFTKYSTTLGKFVEIRVNLNNKSLLLITKDKTQFLLLTSNP